VILVRHAEKASAPADDPPLTRDGQRRAEALADAVKNARPTAVITTNLRRTVETAQPSAMAANITAEQISINPEDVSQNVAAVAIAVRRHQG
jgi:broad specificity phosphatase PhoE